MAGKKGRSGRKPIPDWLKPAETLPRGWDRPAVDLPQQQRLRARVQTMVAKLGLGLSPQREATLIDRLVDIARWYEAGVALNKPLQRGRLTKYGLRIMLHDCQVALSEATGVDERLYQTSDDASGPDETNAVKVARIVGDAAGKSISADLRRQLKSARDIE